MNTKTQTTTTEGYPEAGPFTEAEARKYAASLDSRLVTILAIVQEDDGWYVNYTYKATTTLRQETKKLEVNCLRLVFDTLMGYVRRKG